MICRELSQYLVANPNEAGREVFRPWTVVHAVHVTGLVAVETNIGPT
jgi:hypothetical protein